MEKGMKGKCHVEHLSARLFSSFISFHPNKNFTNFTNKYNETREAETSPGNTSEEVGDRFQTHL